MSDETMAGDPAEVDTGKYEPCFHKLKDDTVRVERQLRVLGGKYRVYRWTLNENIPDMPPHADGGRFQIVGEYDTEAEALAAAEGVEGETA